jgi:hypothetical protein
VSTLIYSVREDWSNETARFEEDRRRVDRAILFVAFAAGPGVFFVDRVVDSVAWRSFVSEALSLCLYGAIAVWYSLRRRPGTQKRRITLLVYLVSLAVMATVDLITKQGLTGPLVDSPRANEPILWAGALMLVFVPALAWLAWRYPVDMSRIGFSLRLSRQILMRFALAGLGMGLLIGLHFWLTIRSAGLSLSLKPWPYMAWQVFYELGPQSLTEELFMRGVVFNELYFTRNWGFWTAALAAASLELFSLLAKQNYGTNALLFVGMMFYTIVRSVASAGLFRWSRSIVPGYVTNVTFGIISMFR